jgi:hypothetical protein
VAFRRETATHGGLEQQTPAQAAVMTLGLPSLSYVPTTQTGVGKARVRGPMDFFMVILLSFDIKSKN